MNIGRILFLEFFRSKRSNDHSWSHFISYVVLDYLLRGRKEYRLNPSAYVRIAVLAGIVVTGIFRVLKNLPDVVFSPEFTLFVDISHLGFMMVYLFAALVFVIRKSGWVAERSF